MILSKAENINFQDANLDYGDTFSDDDKDEIIYFYSQPINLSRLKIQIELNPKPRIFRVIQPNEVFEVVLYITDELSNFMVDGQRNEGDFRDRASNFSVPKLNQIFSQFIKCPDSVESKLLIIDSIALLVNSFGFPHMKERLELLLLQLHTFKTFLQKRILSVLPEICNSLIAQSEVMMEEFTKTPRRFVVETILPFLLTSIKGNHEKWCVELNSDLKQTYFELLSQSKISFLLIIDTLSLDEITSNVLTFIIELANDEENIHNKILAIQLFDGVSHLLSNELCELFVIPQISFLAEDQYFIIRKTVVSNILRLCEFAPSELIERSLIPLFINLSNDLVWSVRKSAADIIHEVTRLSPTRESKLKLLKVYYQFIEDKEKHVRLALLENIGPFLLLFDKSELSNLIIDFYCESIETYIHDGFRDKDIIQKCAYQFPGVLYIYGKEAWPKLKIVYLKLYRDREYNVKKTISASLGEVSRIVGMESTEKDLVQVFKYYWKDEKEIFFNVLESFNVFMLYVSEETKNHLIRKLLKKIRSTAITHSKDWRIKVRFARILGGLTTAASINDVFSKLLAIIIEFTLDNSDSVRKAAASACSVMLIELLKHNLHEKQIQNLIILYAQNETFILRKLFCQMTSQLLPETLNNPEFSCFLKDLILKSSLDKVYCCRHILSKSINEFASSGIIMSENMQDFIRLITININSKPHRHINAEFVHKPDSIRHFMKLKEEV